MTKKEYFEIEASPYRDKWDIFYELTILDLLQYPKFDTDNTILPQQEWTISNYLVDNINFFE